MLRARAAPLCTAAVYTLNRSDLVRGQGGQQGISEPKRDRDPQEAVETRRLPGFQSAQGSQSNARFAGKCLLRHISSKAQLRQAPTDFRSYSRCRS